MLLRNPSWASLTRTSVISSKGSYVFSSLPGNAPLQLKFENVSFVEIVYHFAFDFFANNSLLYILFPKCCSGTCSKDPSYLRDTLLHFLIFPVGDEVPQSDLKSKIMNSVNSKGGCLINVMHVKKSIFIFNYVFNNKLSRSINVKSIKCGQLRNPVIRAIFHVF